MTQDSKNHQSDGKILNWPRTVKCNSAFFKNPKMLSILNSHRYWCKSTGYKCAASTQIHFHPGVWWSLSVFPVFFLSLQHRDPTKNGHSAGIALNLTQVRKNKVLGEIILKHVIQFCFRNFVLIMQCQYFGPSLCRTPTHKVLWHFITIFSGRFYSIITVKIIAKLEELTTVAFVSIRFIRFWSFILYLFDDMMWFNLYSINYPQFRRTFHTHVHTYTHTNLHAYINT